MNINSLPEYLSRTLVMKFGGTSVGSPSAIRKAAEIVSEHTGNWQNVVVVVSAMRGITEILLACAAAAAEGNRRLLVEKIEHFETKNRAVIRELFVNGPMRRSLEASLLKGVLELKGHCEIIFHKQAAVPYLVDAVSSLGERINAKVFAAQLKAAGLNSCAVDATDLIVTDRVFMNASPLAGPTRKVSRRTMAPLFAQGIVPVVTGFIGGTIDGQITTLGRGGSDFTATILGASLGANEVWIWTDVAGVMTADPKLVPEAAVVSRIGYDEIHELANFGGRVLHPKTILPVRRQKIPIRVRHTFDPQFPGTLISHADGADGRSELVVTLLSGCTWDAKNNVLMNKHDKTIVPIRLNNTFEISRRPVSVVSLVGKQACSGGLKEGAYRILSNNNIEIFGSSQTTARNRFSLIVPEVKAQNAIRWIHNEVVQL